MNIDQNFWLLFLANLPLVFLILVAERKKFIVTGRNHEDVIAGYEKILVQKNEEIIFREKLRQEALADKQVLQTQNKDIQTAMSDLATVVQNFVDVNDRLVDEISEHLFEKRWDGNDRRASKTTPRTR